MEAGNADEELARRLANLEAQVAAIEQRNRRVELEKSWETSRVRVVALVVLTYAVMVLLFYMLGQEHYWASALVPTLGYYLSTQSLRVLAAGWMRKRGPPAG